MLINSYIILSRLYLYIFILLTFLQLLPNYDNPAFVCNFSELHYHGSPITHRDWLISNAKLTIWAKNSMHGMMVEVIDFDGTNMKQIK